MFQLLHRPCNSDSTMIIISSSSSMSLYNIICNVILMVTTLTTLSEAKHNGINSLRNLNDQVNSNDNNKYHYTYYSPSASLSSSSSPSSDFQWKPHLLLGNTPSSTITHSNLINFNHVNIIDHLIGKTSNNNLNSRPLSTLISSPSSSSSLHSTSFLVNQPVNNNSTNQSADILTRLMSKRSSSLSSSSSSSSTSSSSTDSLPNHVIRDSCSDDSECISSKTKCMVKQGLCGCTYGYITVDLLTPNYMDIASSSLLPSPSLGSPSSLSSSSSSSSQYVSKFCYKLKHNGENCEHSAQCFVPHATCERINPPISNNQSGICKCKQGYNEQAGNEMLEVNGYEKKSERICVPVVIVVNKTYIKITVALSVLTIMALLACAVIVIKIKRNKRRAQTETSVATSLNGPPNYPGQGPDGQRYLRDLGNPPPMGSAEAEFQNDFIQVFPMHHLEPCPEKNMTALIMQ